MPSTPSRGQITSLLFYLFIYLFLAVLGLCCCIGFSLVAESEDCSLVEVCGLLIVVASLAAEHRLSGGRPSVVGAHGLSTCGSQALEHRLIVVHGLSCFRACGIFLDQGSNLSVLHWQSDSSPLNHQESPAGFFSPGPQHAGSSFQLCIGNAES